MSPITSNDNRCPRCGHDIPNDAEPGAYPGAWSRTDRLGARADNPDGEPLYVCSRCGLAEALRDWNDTPHERERWPLPEAEAWAGTEAMGPWQGNSRLYTQAEVGLMLASMATHEHREHPDD